jgi:hypothetical protein
MVSQNEIGAVVMAGNAVGILVYITRDGWAGIRLGKRVDEYPVKMVKVDPT